MPSLLHSSEYPAATSDSKPVSSNGRGGLTGFLYEKTGVTGAWTLGVGVGAYLLSKELYVINSEVCLYTVVYESSDQLSSAPVKSQYMYLPTIPDFLGLSCKFMYCPRVPEASPNLPKL